MSTVFTGTSFLSFPLFLILKPKAYFLKVAYFAKDLPEIELMIIKPYFVRNYAGTTSLPKTTYVL